MTKAPPRQLEFPLLVNLNATAQLPRKQVVTQDGLKSNESRASENLSLKATAEDLTIYRSISEGFLRRFK